MKGNTKLIVFTILAIIICTSVGYFLCVYVFPGRIYTEIDGRVIKVVRSGESFNVTFDTGNGVLTKLVNRVTMEQIDGHDGRMLIKLYRYTDTLVFHWDCVWYFGSVIKLDNYDS